MNSNIDNIIVFSESEAETINDIATSEGQCSDCPCPDGDCCTDY